MNEPITYGQRSSKAVRLREAVYVRLLEHEAAGENGNENAISTYEIGASPRKRKLAEKAAERFWKLVEQRSPVIGGPLSKLLHLERALAVLPDEDVVVATKMLEDGIAETKALIAELRRHLEERRS